MKDKKIKGFTLVEILCVVVVLGILTTTIVAVVTGYLKSGKESYDEKLENSLLLAGKNYYADNTDRLPRRNNSNIITLAELKNLNYISKDFVDAYGNKCSNQDSLVMVTNDNGKYEYKACLHCDGSEIFDATHLDICDTAKVIYSDTDNDDDNDEDKNTETKTCQIEFSNNKYIVYSSDGTPVEKTSALDAIKKVSESCEISKSKCQNNKFQNIDYYYGNDEKIYENEEKAKANGTCKEVCTSYKLQTGYDNGTNSSHKKVISTTGNIKNKSTLQTVFSNNITSYKSGTTYYLHYIKETAYNEILSSSTSTSSETVTSGSTAKLSEYFNPSSKTKVTKSKNQKVHYNENIPSEYELLLSKSSTKSTVTIPANLKMTQKQINEWGTDFSKYAEYGRVVVADDDAKGNYKVRYSNVGTYQGQKIDVVMTLTSFSGCKKKSSASKCGIWFGPKFLEVYSLGVKRINVKYNFYKAGTNTAITVKGYSTYWDIDANQGIHFLKGTTGIYAYGNNELYVSALNNAPYIFEYNDSLYTGLDERGAVTETFSGSSVTKVFTFMSGNGGDHSKVTSSWGSIEPDTIPIGVSKQYKGSVSSDTVFQTNQQVQFKISYSNITSSAKTLTITDNLSSNMSYVKNSATYNDGTTATPTISGTKVTWKKKVSAHSGGYITYKVKINSCGDIASSYATLSDGTKTFTSQALKNAVVCTKIVNTECATWETS